jgi:hypothetical protein
MWTVYTCTWCWTISRRRAAEAQTGANAADADVVLHRKRDRR